MKTRRKIHEKASKKLAANNPNNTNYFLVSFIPDIRFIGGWLLFAKNAIENRRIFS